MARNVLIIAYHYPPKSNGGVQRPFAFAKYLKKYGFNVYVLTADPLKCFQPEEEKNIYRIKIFDDHIEGKKAINQAIIFFVKAVRKILFKMGFIFIYDYKWFYHSKNELAKIISETTPDVIFSTFPPLNCLLLGIYIKRRYHIPLISDFRDGFLFEGLERLNVIQEFVTKVIEKNVIRNSDAVITVSPPISNYFIIRYNSRKVTTIYNGFDVEDLNTSHLSLDKKTTTKFRMIYFGSFTGSSYRRQVFPLISALDILKRNSIINKYNFELSIFGKLENKELALIRQYDLEDLVKYYGYIDRRDGLKLMTTDCDALLFYGDPCTESVVSTKLLEYIFMNKPILGICKGNEAENIIIKTKTGIVTDFTEESIMEGFKKIINYDDFKPDWDEINRFSREEQTKELIEVIDGLCMTNS